MKINIGENKYWKMIKFPLFFWFFVALLLGFKGIFYYTYTITIIIISIRAIIEDNRKKLNEEDS